MAAQKKTTKSGAAIAVGDIADFRCVALGIAWLAAGVLVYIVARPPGILFLPDALSLIAWFPAWLVALTGPMPVFFHVGAMSYLTIGLLGLGRRGALLACAGWAALDIAFEFGQHELVSAPLAAAIPHAAAGDFFVNGTFDVLDVIAAIAAAFSVYVLTRVNTKTRTHT